MQEARAVSFVDLLEFHPLPELADALRSRVDVIMIHWEASARQVLSKANELTFSQLRNDSLMILRELADALAGSNPTATDAVIESSRQHARIRFDEDYDLRELIIEYRLLRRIIVEEVESALQARGGQRCMSLAEQLTLHMGVDTMLQRGVLAFVEYQQDRLKAATEAQAKYLSFMSHDLRNNINHVTLTLELVKSRLAGMAGLEEDLADLDSVQQSVFATVAGMDRLLQTQRLRHHPQAQVARVDLDGLAEKVAGQFKAQARQKGLRLSVEVPHDARVNSDGEWIGIVLQNLLGNAIKYSSTGTVRVQAKPLPQIEGAGGAEGAGRDGGGWVLSVPDEGPGIADDQVHHMFDAFRRGDTHGQAGVGLGLAVASQAAKLLGGPLTVESKVGVGSTFRLALPDLKGTESQAT